MKPKSFENLINSLKKIPGISKKQSENIAYQMIENKKNESLELIDSINNALNSLDKCHICGHITDKKICNICSDDNRRKILIIVETSLDVFKFENSKQINSYYHVLGRLVGISDKDDLKNLNIDSLVKRKNNFNEIIIALSPNLQGIVTANYLKVLLGDIKITQLAQGIPLGAAMEYVDELTLKAALENRKEVK